MSASSVSASSNSPSPTGKRFDTDIISSLTLPMSSVSSEHDEADEEIHLWDRIISISRAISTILELHVVKES